MSVVTRERGEIKRQNKKRREERKREIPDEAKEWKPPQEICVMFSFIPSITFGNDLFVVSLGSFPIYLHNNNIFSDIILL